MNRLSETAISALGGEQSVSRANPGLVQILGGICDCVDKPDADLAGYQTIKQQLESPWFSTQRGGSNAQVIVEFTNWCAERLPATAAICYAQFPESFFRDFRPESWDVKLAYAFAGKNESLREFDLTALARLLSVSMRHYKDNTRYEQEQYNISLITLYGVLLYGMESIKVDEKTYEALVQARSRAKPLIETELFAASDLKSVRDRLAQGLSSTLSGHDAQESIDQFRGPLNALFAIAKANASVRNQWGVGSSSFMVMAKMLDKANSAGSTQIDMLNPKMAASLVLDTLSLNLDVLREIFKAWKEGSAGFGNLARPLDQVLKGLIMAGAPENEVKNAATNVLAVFAGVCVQKKAGLNLTSKTLGVLFEYAKFSKARSLCTPAARRMLGEYAIAHHPELAGDLSLHERGRTLDNSLGL